MSLTWKESRKVIGYAKDSTVLAQGKYQQQSLEIEIDLVPVFVFCKPLRGRTHSYNISLNFLPFL